MKFNLIATDSLTQARCGELHTGHGVIRTPVFMPVGTLGTVKTVRQEDLEEIIHARIILGNTYHLYLRPGTDVLHAAGGLHRFINWSKPILTDSGGYQVYSLSHRRKIKEEGVEFQSHIDGSRHFFTPESVMDIQRRIGADIIMAFDECTPYPCEKKYARDSMLMTHRWLDRCIQRFQETTPLYGHDQILAPIVQGSTFPDLRRESAEYIDGRDCALNAIGGLSVGEPAIEMYEMTGLVTSVLSPEKPRYLMGVGTPADILECIALGVDMFDCVLPTRNARHGLLYTPDGVININNEKWKFDNNPIDTHGICRVSSNYSRSYLRHLFRSGEWLGMQLATLHNLSFYLWLVSRAEEEIRKGTFLSWKNHMLGHVMNRI